MKELESIDDVIEVLEQVIEGSIEEADNLGYFAALYQKVTIKVRDGINNGVFENPERMEMLDIIFAKRYLDAYFAYKENQPVTESWQKAFDLSSRYWPIVLQHILIGMNAHISLDLGIAAAEVSKGKDIHLLQNDFNKINDILSDLVNEVQENLARIWPTLKSILKKVGKVDDFLVDFSMKLARDGAWDFATSISESKDERTLLLLEKRDQKVAAKVKIITNPGFIVRLILVIVRIGELGSVAARINNLRAIIPK